MLIPFFLTIDKWRVGHFYFHCFFVFCFFLPQHKNYIFLLFHVVLSIHLDSVAVSCSDLEISGGKMSAFSKNIIGLDSLSLVVLKEQKITFWKLNINVSFQKSRPGYSRLSRPFVSSYMEELFSFCVTVQKEMCIYSWMRGLCLWAYNICGIFLFLVFSRLVSYRLAGLQTSVILDI